VNGISVTPGPGFLEQYAYSYPVHLSRGNV
jgi:hypothetical protein